MAPSTNHASFLVVMIQMSTPNSKLIRIIDPHRCFLDAPNLQEMHTSMTSLLPTAFPVSREVQMRSLSFRSFIIERFSHANKRTQESSVTSVRVFGVPAVSL